MEAQLFGPFEIGKEFRTKILYDNVGREPAIDVTIKAGSGLVDPPPVGGLFGQLKVEVVYKTCFAVAPESTKITVYPSTARSYEHVSIMAAALAKQEIKDGTKILYVSGCFRYSTFNRMHLSHFCFFMRSEVGKDVAEWRWRNCPEGNYAN